MSGSWAVTASTITERGSHTGDVAAQRQGYSSQAAFRITSRARSSTTRGIEGQEKPPNKSIPNQKGALFAGWARSDGATPGASKAHHAPPNFLVNLISMIFISLTVFKVPCS